MVIKIIIIPLNAGLMDSKKSLNSQKRKTENIIKIITFIERLSLFIEEVFFIFKKYEEIPETASLISFISLIVKTKIDAEITVAIKLIMLDTCMFANGGNSLESGIKTNFENKRTILKNMHNNMNFGNDLLSLIIEMK
ncbi:MAG: hypothetical protein QXG91_03295 [Candidatus Aenigmatarchaeota archaeon]